MNPVLAMAMPACMALAALPHNHPLSLICTPHKGSILWGALSSSLPSFLSFCPLSDPSFFITFTKMTALLTNCHCSPAVHQKLWQSSQLSLVALTLHTAPHCALNLEAATGRKKQGLKVLLHVEAREIGFTFLYFLDYM